MSHTVNYFGRILVVFWSISVKILVHLRNLTKVIFNQNIFDLSRKKILGNRRPHTTVAPRCGCLLRSESATLKLTT